ncbi:MAG: DNA starvation/stationary phase protection protein [Bacteroidales bacterium]|nr:DNA starvation/stationary phase protection protein [Bacteroidales bacterium]
MNLAKTEKRTFAKLGYTHMDTAEIVSNLNRILAHYSVYYQKIRNFHWNLIGPDFFELYEQFGNMYLRASSETDEIAERIRLFDKFPLSTMAEYLELSKIEEQEPPVSSFEMVKIVISDIRTLIDLLEQAVQSARLINDLGSERMLISFIQHFEKDHWMLTAWSKKGK